MKEKINNTVMELLKGIGTIAFYFLLVIIANILLSKYYKSSNYLIANLSQIGTYIIILLGLSFIYRKKLLKDIKNFKKEYIGIAIKNWILGLGIMIISNIIITTYITNTISVNETANRELLMNYPISSIISMVVIAPFIEEITFRLSFKNAFSKWFTFAIVTSLLFGFSHIAEFNFLEFLFIIPYGALGFSFAKTMYETDNIYPSYISHMIHNAICVIIILLF